MDLLDGGLRDWLVRTGRTSRSQTGAVELSRNGAQAACVFWVVARVVPKE
jgi:hypothetical protein